MCSCPRTRTRKSVALPVPGNLRPWVKLAVLRPIEATKCPFPCQGITWPGCDVAPLAAPETHHAYLPPRASNFAGSKPTWASAASTPTSRMGSL